jgi:hypothetical protein
VLARRLLIVAVLLGSVAFTGCNDYRVRFLYPRENRGDFFSERPEYALYVAEPDDLRPSVERQGRGFIQTLHFPSDDKLDQPASQIVRRALLQDLGQTRVASLVQNPDNADYVLDSELLSMTTELSRPLGAWAIPLATGVAVGALASIGSDGGASHAVKVGLVGAVLGLFIPAPANTRAQVELRLSLREQSTGSEVWSTTCEGVYEKSLRLSLSAREDQKIAEEFLPLALKRANACAVGQLYAFLQEHQTDLPEVGR